MRGGVIMPDHIYRGRTPPTFLDHILAHPWEMTAALFSVLAGALNLASLVAGTTVSPSIGRLPAALIVILGGSLAAGGVQTIRGLLDSSDDLMVGFAKERIGLILTGSAWTVYGVVVLGTFPSAVLTWALGMTMACGSALRLVATLRDERAMRGQA